MIMVTISLGIGEIVTQLVIKDAMLLSYEHENQNHVFSHLEELLMEDPDFSTNAQIYILTIQVAC